MNRQLNATLLLATVCLTSHLSAAEVQFAAEDAPIGKFVITVGTVALPVNRIMLIRSKESQCAIKFLAYGTTHKNGKNIHWANYEFVRFGSDLSASHGQASIETGRFEFKGWWTLGHIPVWRRESGGVNCGKAPVIFQYSTHLYLLDAPFAVAPTAWRDFNTVEIGHPALAWYEIDAQRTRARIDLPLQELPGYEADEH